MAGIVVWVGVVVSPLGGGGPGTPSTNLGVRVRVRVEKFMRSAYEYRTREALKLQSRTNYQHYTVHM